MKKWIVAILVAITAVMAFFWFVINVLSTID
jgi:hypothetical protein